MAWNVLLTGAATVLGLAGIGLAAQEPDFDYQVAAPAEKAAPSLTNFQYTNTATSGVSAHFHDARVSEVLEWLDHQGLNYVIADATLNDHKITLNVENQPVDDVADAIASALGGHWEHQGKVRVYRSGANQNIFFDNEDRNFVLPKGDWNALPQMVPDKGGQFRVFGNEDRTFVMPKGDWKALPQMVPDKGGQFKVFTMGPDGKFPGKTLGKDDLKVEELFKGDGKKPFGAFLFNQRFDFDKFHKSLTDHQADLLKSQGYLKIADLTPSQRDMIGVKEGENDLTIMYTKDGQTITIKSK